MYVWHTGARSNINNKKHKQKAMKTKNNKTHKMKSTGLLTVAAVTLLSCSSWAFIGQASALPAFQKGFVRLDTLKATTATGGRVCVNPSVAGAATEGKIIVTFPTTGATDYVVNSTAANWTTNTTGLDAGQTALPITSNVASNVTGKAVTFTVTSDLSAGTLYCFNFSGTSTLTTSSAGAVPTTGNTGNIQTQTAGSAPIDQTYFDESIITNDAVVVTAIVPPSFQFTLSANTDAFVANLNASATPTLTSGTTITILTNAASGWIVWARDLLANSSGGKGSLMSAAAGNYKITNTAAVGAASHTHPAATENYGLAVVTVTDAGGGGTVTANAAYDGTAASLKAGTLDATQFQPIASANGTANNDSIVVKEQATIAGQTPAGSDYTDTITLIGAGQF